MELKDFLIEAKVNTYANNEEGKEKILENGGKELTFEKENWKYCDRYFGFDSFIGEEIVWMDDKIVWGMNYAGRILSDKINILAPLKNLKVLK